jgi:hypothetical protein
VSLRFPYAPDATAVLPAAAVPPGAPPVRYRPILAVRVYGPDPPGRHLQMGALVDSGSDWTVFRRHIAAMIGVTDFFASTNVMWRGVSIPIELANVELEISLRNESWRWPAVVGFIQARLPYPALLGQTGFLEFMHSELLGDQRALRLETNSLFQSVGGQKAP